MVGLALLAMVLLAVGLVAAVLLAKPKQGRLMVSAPCCRLFTAGRVRVGERVHKCMHVCRCVEGAFAVKGEGMTRCN